MLGGGGLVGLPAGAAGRDAGAAAGGLVVFAGDVFAGDVFAGDVAAGAFDDDGVAERAGDGLGEGLCAAHAGPCAKLSAVQSARLEDFGKAKERTRFLRRLRGRHVESGRLSEGRCFYQQRSLSR